MKITTGTIIRTICLALALTNQILVACGYSVIPIDDATIETLITEGAVVITAVAAWWKNNSFTKSALAGDEVKEIYKAESKLNDLEEFTDGKGEAHE